MIRVMNKSASSDEPLMVLLSTEIALVANSTPMVDLVSILNSLRVNLERTEMGQ